MIVKNDFLNHWKTRLLCKRLGDGPALRALLSLWAYCEQRRAWRFSLTPLELAGVCDYGEDQVGLYHTLLELRLIEEVAPGVFEVNGWGEVNASLVAKWPGRKLAAGEFYHPSGHIAQRIAEPIPQPIAPHLPQPIARAIGLDRIGLDRSGSSTTTAAASDSDPEPDPDEPVTSTPPRSAAPVSEKKDSGGALEPEVWWPAESREAVRALNRALLRDERRALTPAEGMALMRYAATWDGMVSSQRLARLGRFLAAPPRFDSAAEREWEAVPKGSLLRERKRRVQTVLDDLPNQCDLAERWESDRAGGEKKKAARHPLEVTPEWDWEAVTRRIAPLHGWDVSVLADIDWTELSAEHRETISAAHEEELA